MIKIKQKILKLLKYLKKKNKSKNPIITLGALKHWKKGSSLIGKSL